MHNKFFAISYLLILLPLLASCQHTITGNSEVFTDDNGREVTIKRKNVRCEILVDQTDNPHRCIAFGYYVDDGEVFNSGEEWCPDEDNEDVSCKAAELWGLY